MIDPIAILQEKADSCSRAEDGAFWILTSAIFHLEGHTDDEGSTAEAYFWGAQ